MEISKIKEALYTNLLFLYTFFFKFGSHSLFRNLENQFVTFSLHNSVNQHELLYLTIYTVVAIIPLHAGKYLLLSQ